MYVCMSELMRSLDEPVVGQPTREEDLQRQASLHGQPILKARDLARAQKSHKPEPQPNSTTVAAAP